MALLLVYTMVAAFVAPPATSFVPRTTRTITMMTSSEDGRPGRVRGSGACVAYPILICYTRTNEHAPV